MALKGTAFTNRIKAAKDAKKADQIGRGDNLWLRITEAGRMSWVFRYMVRGKAHHMEYGTANLGGVKGEFTEAEALEWAREQKKLKKLGKDPITERNRERTAEVPTFGKVVDDRMALKGVQYKNSRTATDWKKSLVRHAASLWDMPIDRITRQDVIAVLKPIWNSQPKLGTDVKDRIRLTWDFAKGMGHVTGENPAIWKGGLETVLVPIAQVRQVQHHPALPWEEMPAFMADLRACSYDTARALEFTIYTNQRTNVVLEALRREIDLFTGVWTIPKAKLKGKKNKLTQDFRCPLSKQAVAILKAIFAEQPNMRPNDRIFPLSHGGMAQCLATFDRVDPKSLDEAGNPRGITVHGFRSSFRDWAEDCTDYKTSVIETAMQHVAEVVEGSYRRGDQYPKREQLMQDWADYADGTVPLIRTVNGYRIDNAA